MQTQTLREWSLVLATAWVGGLVFCEELQFRHHFIDRTSPATDKLVSDYGLTALVDPDRDGDIDICSKPLGPRPWNGNGGKMHVDFLENLLNTRKPAPK